MSQQLDAIILAVIGAGCTDMTAITNEVRVRLESRDPELFKAVERRLQLLRKAGRIEHIARKWQVHQATLF